MEDKLELLLGAYDELDDALDMVVNLLMDDDYTKEEILQMLFNRLGGLQ